MTYDPPECLLLFSAVILMSSWWFCGRGLVQALQSELQLGDLVANRLGQLLHLPELHFLLCPCHLRALWQIHRLGGFNYRNLVLTVLDSGKCRISDARFGVCFADSGLQVTESGVPSYKDIDLILKTPLLWHNHPPQSLHLQMSSHWGLVSQQTNLVGDAGIQ
jgi:hypothetical protein